MFIFLYGFYTLLCLPKWQPLAHMAYMEHSNFYMLYSQKFRVPFRLNSTKFACIFGQGTPTSEKHKKPRKNLMALYICHPRLADPRPVIKISQVEREEDGLIAQKRIRIALLHDRPKTVCAKDKWLSIFSLPSIERTSGASGWLLLFFSKF